MQYSLFHVHIFKKRQINTFSKETYTNVGQAANIC